MKPRITFSLTSEGILEMWMNEAGRDLLVQKLNALSEKRDHVHFGPPEIGEIEVSSRSYRPSDRVLEYGKIMFRPDQWDRQYFPHLFDSETDEQ